MSGPSLLFARENILYPSSLLLEREEWGLRSVDVVNPPRRFWSDQSVPMPVVEPGLDSRRLCPVATPASLLRSIRDDDTWAAQSRRSVERLQAFFLVCEDPQRRMDAREVETLAHQISLVRHVLDSEHLRRVLIADEVGLGKTVEVGLLLKELLEQRPGLRVLYLAPARLVSNVRREFDRLRLSFRQWTAVDGDARLSDPKIIASIHRAVHGENFDRMLKTTPWDVLIVDECHHLSAWSPGGGDPREAFKLVRELIGRQPSDGRVIFLSGTPHQGHVTRFENLLALLRAPAEPMAALSGRVIYRTKDDVRDWDDHPLFPPRQVNEPIVVDLGTRYRSWIENIHLFYKPPQSARGTAESKFRAAGWRCAQALQWAASSPQAGLGYLVRQAVRAKWDLRNKIVGEALGALRPYRMGPADEPIDQLFQRILKEVGRQHDEGDVDDIEDDTEAAGLKAAMQGLENLLEEGLAIVRSSANDKWNVINEQLLVPAGDEKIVLFAQPIETVMALAAFLHKHAGRKPALIIGGQSDSERQAEVESFRRPDGPQYLVSSRAGGEGINLQVARHLIHIDVPWNPMDLEQRVGRVHRFGSRKTILVDTVVVKDSREADAYRIARQKLQIIASTLVAKDRFEQIFSRVMCLVPPEELQDVLLAGAQSPFNSSDQEKIAAMVQRGFQTWREFHERFGAQQREIRRQPPGLVTWEDMRHFAQDHLDANPADGFKRQRFRMANGQVDAIEESAVALRLGDGQMFACGESGGMPVFGPDGKAAPQLGLNLPPVAETLRRLAFPQAPTGAAHLRWPAAMPVQRALPCGILVFLRQTVRAHQHGSWVEQANAVVVYVVRRGSAPELIGGPEKAQLLRAMFQGTVRTKPEQDAALLDAIQEQEGLLAQELRRPTDDEMKDGIRHAVTPLFAGTVANRD